MVNYRATYINRDIAKLFPRLDKIVYRRFITMLGKLSSKIINKSDLARSIGILPIKIKYGSTVVRRQLRALSDFIKLRDLPFGILINQSESIEWLTDNILQVPVGFL